MKRLTRTTPADNDTVTLLDGESGLVTDVVGSDIHIDVGGAEVARKAASFRHVSAGLRFGVGTFHWKEVP